MIGATNLTGLNPVETFQNLVTTAIAAGTASLYNATGSQLTYLDVTAKSASYEIIYESSASWADFAGSSSFAHRGITSSFAPRAFTSSYFQPSAGAVTNVTIPSGSSAGAAGFTSAAELATFIQDVSASAVRLNYLMTLLREKGLIS